jgi:hypothetical protein
MPNWCQNVVTFSHAEPSKLDAIREAVDVARHNSGENFMNVFVPRPESEKDNWYDWNVTNWGTKWDINPEISEDNGDSITLTFDSAWAPPIEFYNTLQNELGYEVMAYYNEEGMAFAGIYDHGSDDYYEYGYLTSEQVACTLPGDLDEMFCISENKEMWEDENEEEENDE